jgi:hypothetical protein
MTGFVITCDTLLDSAHQEWVQDEKLALYRACELMAQHITVLVYPARAAHSKFPAEGSRAVFKASEGEIKRNEL